MIRPMIVALLGLTLTGCHQLAANAALPRDSAPTAVSSASPSAVIARLYATPSVSFRTLLQGSHLIYEGEGQNAVIHSAQDWEAFLAKHPHNEPRAFSLDFTREQGVLVQLGPQPTGMIQVEIVSIEEQADQFVVHGVRWLPASDVVTDDIGYPTHYVAMARSDKPVIFAPLVDAKANERPTP